MKLQKKLWGLCRSGMHNLFVRKQYKISFCTVSMNRLHHIKQTLPANLRDNASYPNAEFVLLDYNSSDGLEEWIKSDLKEFIDLGRLVYYKTTEPQYFHRSHSRNMAFSLATGDIVCNIDADNFMGKDFAHYINREFILNSNIFIIPDIHNRYYYIRDVFGRIVCWKQDFDAVGGFDEDLDGYGHEDVDLIFRLIRLNREEVVIHNRGFLKAIAHTDLERIQHESSLGNLKKLYIAHLAPHASRILYLFSDGSFSVGTLIDTLARDAPTTPPMTKNDPAPESLNGRFLLTENIWRKGVWQDSENMLRLSYNDGTEEIYGSDADTLAPITEEATESFLRITDLKTTIRAVNVYSLIKNSTKVNINKTRELLSTTELPIGKGHVVKNFTEEVAIGV